MGWGGRERAGFARARNVRGGSVRALPRRRCEQRLATWHERPHRGLSALVLREREEGARGLQAQDDGPAQGVLQDASRRQVAPRVPQAPERKAQGSAGSRGAPVQGQIGGSTSSSSSSSATGASASASASS